ncbi:MAG: 50S ribosomal protein L4 [Armatimonadetes bacterium]|nr:50S ribosomal protein L4 [Armatimonadota bacterium]
MATLAVYSLDGKQVSELELPESVFGADVNEGLLHEAVVAGLRSRRQGNAQAKTRGEVSGSRRKLWRQKGTGRARVGDRFAPHWKGGGVAMGPRGRTFRYRLSRRARLEALRSALTAQVRSEDVILLEPLELPEAKTRVMQGLLDALGVAGNALLVLPTHDDTVWRCGRNIPGLTIHPATDINALDVLAARKVVLTTDAISALEKRLS